ncbi:Lsa25.6 family adhesin [Leptospira sanjuanensis]
MQFLSFFYGCKSPFEVTSHDQNKDGQIDNRLYTKTDSKISIFMETFERQKKMPDDWMWLKMDSKDPKSFQTFYNEIASKDPNKIDIKIWFGPDNIKLIEKDDKDSDGFFETTQYFNRFAKPKINSGIIARIEIDSDRDGKPDIWIYPMKRMELDTNQDGVPDQFSTDNEQIGQILKTGKLPIDFKRTSILPSSRSWGLHPELIQDETLKAVIPFSL